MIILVRVRVYRVSSITDPETGQPGKQIELVEVRRKAGVQQFTAFGDEARVVQGILGQFQSMGILPQIRELVTPKLSLFLTENEYDILGIRFEVNDVYEVEMKNGSIVFKKPQEGV